MKHCNFRNYQRLQKQRTALESWNSGYFFFKIEGQIENPPGLGRNSSPGAGISGCQEFRLITGYYLDLH